MRTITELVANGSNEFDKWRELLHETRFVGEVGLDASPRFYNSFAFQKDVFKKLLIACAEEGGKVLSVHSLHAVTPVLDLIESFLPMSRGTVILHWFTGTLAEAWRAINLGCYFSINSQMTRREGNIKLFESIPTERVLTESDGPFAGSETEALSMVGLKSTVTSLARIKKIESSALAGSIVSNFNRLEQ